MMDMEKLCQLLLAKMEADKEEMKANRKKDKEDLMEKLDVYWAKTDAVLLAMQVMETSHKGDSG
jgi:hypothetical protein